jgi:hypothetical protein
MTTYAHLARFARYVPCGRNIPGTQYEAARPARKIRFLGFAAKYTARLMDEILTPIPIDLRDLKREKSSAAADRSFIE